MEVQWSSRPSNLTDSFKHSMEMEKVKTKLIVDAFRATQPIPPPMYTPKMITINEGSPIEKDDSLPAPELVLPISEVIVALTARHVIQVTLELQSKIKEMELHFLISA